MLNIISSDKQPNFKYEEMGRKFLDNTLAFTYGYFTGDTAHFDPIVLKEMANDSTWLEYAAGDMQAIIIQSLEGDENFEDLEQLKAELIALLNLYIRMAERKTKESEEELFLRLYDKFMILLLCSEQFVSYLAEAEKELQGNRKKEKQMQRRLRKMRK